VLSSDQSHRNARTGDSHHQKRSGSRSVLLEFHTHMRHFGGLGSFSQIYGYRIASYDPPVHRRCSALAHKRQIDARVAGAGSVVGGGELLGSAKKLDHKTCRGGGVDYS